MGAKLISFYGRWFCHKHQSFFYQKGTNKGSSVFRCATMRGTALAVLVIWLVAVSATETDFWFEETRSESAAKKQVASKQADLFDSITNGEQSMAYVQPNTPLEELENRKPGPVSHVMLQAFDENGDGLLSSIERAKINKNVCIDVLYAPFQLTPISHRRG